MAMRRDRGFPTAGIFLDRQGSLQGLPACLGRAQISLLLIDPLSGREAFRDEGEITVKIAANSNQRRGGVGQIGPGGGDFLGLGRLFQITKLRAGLIFGAAGNCPSPTGPTFT